MYARHSFSTISDIVELSNHDNNGNKSTAIMYIAIQVLILIRDNN